MNLFECSECSKEYDFAPVRCMCGSFKFVQVQELSLQDKPHYKKLSKLQKKDLIKIIIDNALFEKFSNTTFAK